MHLIHNADRGAAKFDAAHIRDRLTWVSRARAVAATSRESDRSRKQPAIHLCLPHQTELDQS
jgi:hypothetical protein